MSLFSDNFGDILLRSKGKLPLYSGRISSRKVREGRYDYGYDNFGRLTEAAFSGNALADYSTEYSYDANANLRSIVRAGVVDRAGTGKIYGALDVLNVSLEGNRAVRYDIESDGDVFEGRTGFGVMNDSYDIEYDSNGNVVFDGSVLCAYVYNRLNQPVLIEAEDGVMTLDYDGSGTLLSRRSEVDGVVTVTEYLGPYELVDGVFKAAYFDGGYFDADGMVHYYVPDYQGNIIADVTADGEIVQTASYYPYGEPWLEPEGDNRRLYGGKERLNFGALRHSDYGPRLLDTRSGRWNSQDPCAEDFYPLSPYNVCGGDPINYVDRDGRRFTEFGNIAASRLFLASAMLFYSTQNFEYLQTIKEIAVLYSSPQLYHVGRPSTISNFGSTVYNLTMDAVVARINEGEYADLDILSHEFKHMYQFETGSICLAVEEESLISYGNPIAYDYYDEKEAYQRGKHFGGVNMNLSQIRNNEKYANCLQYETSAYDCIDNIPGSKERKIDIKFYIQYQRLSNIRHRVFRIYNQTFKPQKR